MNIDQFLKNLDTFGADLDQWSDPHERKEAQAFLLTSLEARQAFESAQRLEELIIGDAQNNHKAPRHVLDAINKITQAHANNDKSPVYLPANRPASWVPRKHWPTVLAAAIPLIISFAAGVSLGLQPPDADAKTSEYVENIDVNSWVYADSLSQNTIEFSAFFPAAEEGLDNDAT
jgi:hypothetical protein